MLSLYKHIVVTLILTSVVSQRDGHRDITTITMPIDIKQIISKETECGKNEVFKTCETCRRTCNNAELICSEDCMRGCFCVEGFFRDEDGTCVFYQNCSKFIKETEKRNETFSENTELVNGTKCGAHQVYKTCQACEKSCLDPYRDCQHSCMKGCFCADGYYKSPGGLCVKLQDCPKAHIITMGEANEDSIEECMASEVFVSCGWCEGTCLEPKIDCPANVCTRGCLCKPPLLRHHSGQCVEERNCVAQKCQNPNEEYVCRYGCEPRCERQTCSRPWRCSLGCHCKLGLLRHNTGECVTEAQCDKVVY